MVPTISGMHRENKLLGENYITNTVGSLMKRKSKHNSWVSF